MAGLSEGVSQLDEHSNRSWIGAGKRTREDYRELEGDRGDGKTIQSLNLSALAPAPEAGTLTHPRDGRPK